MNITYSLDQIQKTGDLNADLIMRQYKLDKMAKFMEIKSNNRRLKQSEIAKLMELSPSTIRQYRTEINMLSPYRIPQSSETNLKKTKVPNRNIDNVKVTSSELKITSNDLKTISNEPVKNKKNKLKGGENIEINEKSLDEIVHNNYLWMDLAIQLIAEDKTVRSDTVQDLKEYNNKSLATQAKKGEQLVSMMPAIRKAFNLLGDDTI